MRVRAQANLAALALGLVALTTVTVFGVVVADGALVEADRRPLDRRAAVTVADRFVAADSPTTVRANVLDRDVLSTMTAARLDRLAPPVAGRAVRVVLDDRVLIDRGTPTGGVTVQRVVLVAERSERTHRFDLAEGSAFTLPRRTGTVTLTLARRFGVETVRANGRVVLHDPAGLDGAFQVRLSRYDTTTLSFAGTDLAGTVEATTTPERTRKAMLVVTVDA